MNVVYVPALNQTFTCEGGPPFIFAFTGEQPPGNCSFQQEGQPSGLVCDTQTTFTIEGFATYPAFLCASAFGGGPPPPPEGKAACKEGGYAVLGFKNQGQCIKAVNQAH